MATGGDVHCPPSPLLVRVSETCAGLERKLQIYFQSPRKSGGGECTVKAGPTKDTFWVEFLERKAKEAVMVKSVHSVEVSAMSHVMVSLEANKSESMKNTLEISQLSSQNQSLQKEFSDEKYPDAGSPPSPSNALIQKIFLHVEAHLNSDLVSKEQREKIMNLCPNLKIERSHDGIEKVSGDYQDIETIHQFLSERILGNDQKEKFPHSAAAKEIEQIRPHVSTVLHSNPEHRTQEESDIISIPSDLFEYFKCVSADALERINKKHKVHIKSTLGDSVGTVNLVFETSKVEDRKAAQDDFIEAFQSKIQNVQYKKVDFPDDKLTLEIQKTLADMYKTLHITARGKVLILLGSLEDILAAKQFIEVKLSQKQTVDSSNMVKNGIEINTAYLHPLSQEILQTEIKYDITTEKMNKPQTQTTVIVFKPKSNGLDLSAHAYQYFIDSIQMISPWIVREVVSLEPLSDQWRNYSSEKTFFEDCQAKHPFVNLEWNGLVLTMIGFPRHIEEVIKYMQRYFTIKASIQQTERPAPFLGATWIRDPISSLDRNGDDLGKPLSLSNGLSSHRDLGKEKKAEEVKEECVICMDVICQKEVLPKCKHEFCGPCIKEAMKFKPVCPVCQTSYGTIKGNQPDGTMTFYCVSVPLPGYPLCGTIVINYCIPSNIQTEDHPNPGKPYKGTTREAYLPNNKEGLEVLQLLKRAFNQKLIFTVGRSRTTGAEDVVTWNDIHHKTKKDGGPLNYGYPDPSYLERVKLELKAKGIE